MVITAAAAAADRVSDGFRFGLFPEYFWNAHFTGSGRYYGWDVGPRFPGANNVRWSIVRGFNFRW